MNNKNFYVYLGKCIQKIRYGNYNQNELTEGICSKFTLSRIENGKIPSDIKIIDKLIKRLNYTSKDVVDLTIMQSLLKHLEAEIEYNHVKEIISDINKMNTLIERNENNILFIDYKILYEYLNTHYIKNEYIHINEFDLNTLDFHNDAFYSVIVSVISENLLMNGFIHEFIQFFETLNRQSGNIILNFFQILYLQYNGQTLKVNDIFNLQKDELIRDMKTYQLIRYYSVQSLCYIEYEPEKALRNFHKILLLHEKCNRKNHYIYITIMGIAIIYINKEDYLSAYLYFVEFIKDYPQLIKYTIPYTIFLSFRINQEVDKIYLEYGYNALCDACIDYYHFHTENKTGTAHVKFLDKSFLKLVSNYRYNDTFITLLRKEELYQVSRSHCYKTGVRFHKKLKDNCKEVIPL